MVFTVPDVYTSALPIPSNPLSVWEIYISEWGGRWKCRTRKCRTWKWRTKMAGVENAGPENPGPNVRGGKCRPENAGPPVNAANRWS